MGFIMSTKNGLVRMSLNNFRVSKISFEWFKVNKGIKIYEHKKKSLFESKKIQ